MNRYVFQLNIHKNCMYYLFSTSVLIIFENNFAKNPATLLPHPGKKFNYLQDSSNMFLLI
jgi:hypothetical protein